LREKKSRSRDGLFTPRTTRKKNRSSTFKTEAPGVPEDIRGSCSERKAGGVFALQRKHLFCVRSEPVESGKTDGRLDYRWSRGNEKRSTLQGSGGGKNAGKAEELRGLGAFQSSSSSVWRGQAWGGNALPPPSVGACAVPGKGKAEAKGWKYR